MSEAANHRSYSWENPAMIWHWWAHGIHALILDNSGHVVCAWCGAHDLDATGNRDYSRVIAVLQGDTR